MRTHHARLGATVLAAAVLTLAAAGAALATDTPPIGGPVSANPALINPTATTTLHITKYQGAPTGGTNDGTATGGVSTLPVLGGVTYAAYPVTGVDLTTNAGWTAAATYDDNIATAAANLGPQAGTCTTSATTGQCSITPLPVGLYYVKEVSAPAGITMGAPFLVTMPMTNPTNTTSWMYDVYVYPKNQSDTITKTVSDKGTQTTDDSTGAAADHAVDYTLTSSVTDGTDPLGTYVIYDDLAATLSFTGADLSVGGAALVAGTDYTVYTAATLAGPFTAYTGGTVAGGPVVDIVLTDAGLAKLAADRSADVTTVIHTTVGAEDADGVIPNTASFIPNADWWTQNGTQGVNPETPVTTPPGGTTPPGLPSDEVLTKYGDVSITKVDGGSATTKLAGAEFTVYQDANGDGTCAPTEMVAANVLGGPVTTDATGVATYRGLQTSDFYNGGTQTTKITYCLVETKAPTGYNLNAQPISFQIAQAATGTLALTTLTVSDELSNLGNSLPLTGGAGVAGMSVLALLLVGGGVGYYAYGRRREDEQGA